MNIQKFNFVAVIYSACITFGIYMLLGIWWTDGSPLAVAIEVVAFLFGMIAWMNIPSVNNNTFDKPQESESSWLWIPSLIVVLCAMVYLGFLLLFFLADAPIDMKGLIILSLPFVLALPVLLYAKRTNIIKISWKTLKLRKSWC